MAPIIFVSCGQYTDQEKNLGKAVCDVLRSHGLEPYFAENQMNLSGLHSNILNKLNECSGLVAIMHPRGIVNAFGNQHTRGSVWIEQEIAIAAFMTHCLKKNMEVVVFTHEDIRREGIRDLLQLNPIAFRDDAEIVSKLPTVIKTWKSASPKVDLVIRYWKAGGDGNHHDYQLEFLLKNLGEERITQFQFDLIFPRAFVSQGVSYAAEQGRNRTATHLHLRMTERDWPGLIIYPGDTQRIFLMDYCVDLSTFHNAQVMESAFTATLRCGDQPVITMTRPIRDYQKF